MRSLVPVQKSEYLVEVPKQMWRFRTLAGGTSWDQETSAEVSRIPDHDERSTRSGIKSTLG